MRTKWVGKKMIEQEIMIEQSVTCNKCGKVMKVNEHQCAIDENYNHPQKFNCSFGYYSSFDGESWDFDLCQHCLIEFVRTFSIVPDGFMTDRTYSSIAKNRQKTFETWKRTGEWNSFLNYSVEELEEYRGALSDKYLDDLIERCKLGQLDDR